MVGPSLNWDTVLVYGTWRNPATGQPITGKVRFTFPVRIQAVTDDIIFPAGTAIEATLSNLGSVGAYLPAVDDPDIVSDNGDQWSIQVTELLDVGTSETYSIRPLVAHATNGYNLRTKSGGSAPASSVYAATYTSTY